MDLSKLALHPTVAQRAQELATAGKTPISIRFEPSGATLYRGIDASNGVIDRLLHTGLSVLLAVSGGALAERFRRVANTQI